MLRYHINLRSFFLKNHPGWKSKKKTSQRRPEPYSPAPGGRFGKLDGNGRCGPDGLSIQTLYNTLHETNNLDLYTYIFTNRYLHKHIYI